MKKILCLIFLIIHTIAARAQEGFPHIVFRNNNQYLSYPYKGRMVELLLPFHFDSTILKKNILYLTQRGYSVRNNLVVNDLLLVCLTDFSKYDDHFLCFIDQKANKIVEVKKGGVVSLETGLPYFLVTGNGTVVATDTFFHTDAAKQTAVAHYYNATNTAVKLKTNKKCSFNMPDIAEDSFIVKKAYKKLLSL